LNGASTTSAVRAQHILLSALKLKKETAPFGRRNAAKQGEKERARVGVSVVVDALVAFCCISLVGGRSS
jgi:hypothetical protein